jgi:K+-sensing histidine kinase KdpD
MGDVAGLFDPFEPVEGSQAVVRLALAVAKRVVDGSGGTLEASSAEAGEQRAATFVVRLPAAPAPEHAAKLAKAVDGAHPRKA